MANNLRQRPDQSSPKVIVVTGAAGFIGSHLTRRLLQEGHEVRGLDNLSAVGERNLPDITAGLTVAQAARFTFVRGDIVDLETCRRVAAGSNCLVHLAALNSVPRSLAEPSKVMTTNVVGTTNIFEAAVTSGVTRVVYASSSSVYGDHIDPVRLEERLGGSMSPYAASKRACELIAEAYRSNYEVETVGLRYFNVFGTRQNPDGDYAAVIPRWVERAISGKPLEIYGSGTQTRDFTHVSNITDATHRAALLPNVRSGVYNVGGGSGTSLLGLAEVLSGVVSELLPWAPQVQLLHREPRRGDVVAATAGVENAAAELGYSPCTTLQDGLREMVAHRIGKTLASVSDNTSKT